MRSRCLAGTPDRIRILTRQASQYEEWAAALIRRYRGSLAAGGRGLLNQTLKPIAGFWPIDRGFLIQCLLAIAQVRPAHPDGQLIQPSHHQIQLAADLMVQNRMDHLKSLHEESLNDTDTLFLQHEFFPCARAALADQLTLWLSQIKS